jgi:hypothetical protein
MRAGRYEEAEQAILRYKNVLPGTGGELTLGTIRLLEGDFEGAEEAFSEREDEIGRRFGKLLLRAARGENGTLLDDIAEFSEQDPHLGPVAIVQLFATASDVESAFRLLAMSTKDVPNWKMASLTADIRFENLHSDPRWLALEERAGVAPHQLAEIRFNPRVTYVDWNTE